MGLNAAMAENPRYLTMYTNLSADGYSAEVLETSTGLLARPIDRRGYAVV